MPKSLARGDYRLMMAIESSSRQDSWYRTLTDRTTGALSCDCPPWIFNREAAEADTRSCHHTRVATLLSQSSPARQIAADTPPNGLSADAADALIQVTQQQWPGLRGQWEIESRDAPINQHPYRFVLLRLAPGNGGVATGTVAFCLRHPLTEARLQAGVAGWCGYAIAAEVARLGGFPLAGQPPEHFRVQRRAGSAQRAARAPRPAEHQVPIAARIGLTDILRIGDLVDLGDGLRPQQRAENTLRLFLGEQLYTQLETQHFLDVSSVRYADRQRVYRLRRDPAKQRERRLRIFERGHYVNDFCIVRAQMVPEADHLLTIFLSLLSDEQATLSVVHSHNVFSPNSDGPERETVPARWQARAVC